jgi:hypothetical protein
MELAAPMTFQIHPKDFTTDVICMQAIAPFGTSAAYPHSN